jgi:hypothetical protein
VAAVFAASAGKGAGTARVSGAVGSLVVVGHVPGCHIPAPAAAPAHPGGGIRAEVGLALIAALALAGIVAAGRWLRRQPAVGVQLRQEGPNDRQADVLDAGGSGAGAGPLGARDARGHHR